MKLQICGDQVVQVTRHITEASTIGLTAERLFREGWPEEIELDGEIFSLRMEASNEDKKVYETKHGDELVVFND